MYILDKQDGCAQHTRLVTVYSEKEDESLSLALPTSNGVTLKDE